MPAALLARAAHIDERELVDWGSVAEPLGEPVSLTRGLLLLRDDDGGNETGLWVCTPGCWRCAIERPELCHFLAGRAVYLSLHECDLCLKEAVRREGATWAEARLSRFGAKAGSARVMALRHSDPKMAEAFCRTRLSGDHGATYGPLPPGLQCRDFIARARPQTPRCFGHFM